MNEFIYNLLLTSELGFSLSGLLRYRAAPTNATAPDDAPPAPAGFQQAEPVDLLETPLEGSVVIRLLSGVVPQRLRGTLFSTAGGPLSVVLFSNDSPGLVLQFSFLLPGTIAGGLLWQPGAPGGSVIVPYSLLGRRLGAAA
ncbi:MAG: hypothetical protein ABW069_04565 [Duganella sp.]